MDKETYRQFDRIEAMLSRVYEKVCPEDFKDDEVKKDGNKK